MEVRQALEENKPHVIALSFLFRILLNFVAKPVRQFWSQRMRNAGVQLVIDLLRGQG